MTFARAVMVAVLLAGPAALDAQGVPVGGVGGRPAGRVPPRVKRPPEPPSAKDLEKNDPVALLLDKRKALGLTKEQVGRLEALRADLAARNESLFTRVDSLRKTMRPRRGEEGAPDAADRMRAGLDAYSSAVRTIDDHNEDAAGRALQVMTEAQRPAAEALLDEHRAKRAREAEARRRSGGPGA